METLHETPDEPVIEPASITVTQVTESLAEIEVPAGYVLLVALDEAGAEKPASEFFYPAAKYKRYYGDETKFRVKQTHEITYNNPTYYETLHRTSQQITFRTTGKCSSCGK